MADGVHRLKLSNVLIWYCWQWSSPMGELNTRVNKWAVSVWFSPRGSFRAKWLEDVANKWCAACATHTHRSTDTHAQTRKESCLRMVGASSVSYWDLIIRYLESAHSFQETAVKAPQEKQTDMQPWPKATCTGQLIILHVGQWLTGEWGLTKVPHPTQSYQGLNRQVARVVVLQINCQNVLSSHTGYWISLGEDVWLLCKTFLCSL